MTAIRTQKLPMEETSLFRPPLLLRNPHIQTILASLAPRKKLAGKRARKLLMASRETLLDCGDGVRLLGYASIQPDTTKGLVTLIHGWEGSSDSAYILSAAGVLYDHGYSIFRLNLRDHGQSHHLNRELFNSTRLAEVAGGLRAIFRSFPHTRNFLVGFSLGGNFVLRLATMLPTDKGLNQCIAICPLIDPVETTATLEQDHPVYHHYFVRKWRRSLSQKAACFADLHIEELLRGKSRLHLIHDAFVPRHTPYNTTRDYFLAYRITNTWLEKLRVPTHIIMAEDDPIISARHFNTIKETALLTIERQRCGGHCGFLQSLDLSSWLDFRLVNIFDKL